MVNERERSRLLRFFPFFSNVSVFGAVRFDIRTSCYSCYIRGFAGIVIIIFIVVIFVSLVSVPFRHALLFTRHPLTCDTARPHLRHSAGMP